MAAGSELPIGETDQAEPATTGRPVHPALAPLRGGLIVSCQARPDNPLHGPLHMAAMARAAEAGGAGGLRMNGPGDIRAAREATALPVFGIYKRQYEGFPVVITPTFAEALAVAEAGASVVALDATSRPRPNRESFAGLAARIRGELGLPVMADVSSLEEGLAAEAAGADAVATTLSGYVDPAVPPPAEPDLDLVAALAGLLRVPVVAEGRLNTPALARAALEAGAFAVVVGTAITNPREITRRFAEEIAPLHTTGVAYR